MRPAPNCRWRTMEPTPKRGRGAGSLGALGTSGDIAILLDRGGTVVSLRVVRRRPSIAAPTRPDVQRIATAEPRPASLHSLQKNGVGLKTASPRPRILRTRRTNQIHRRTT